MHKYINVHGSKHLRWGTASHFMPHRLHSSLVTEALLSNDRQFRGGYLSVNRWYHYGNARFKDDFLWMGLENSLFIPNLSLYQQGEILDLYRNIKKCIGSYIKWRVNNVVKWSFFARCKNVMKTMWGIGASPPEQRTAWDPEQLRSDTGS